MVWTTEPWLLVRRALLPDRKRRDEPAHPAYLLLIKVLPARNRTVGFVSHVVHAPTQLGRWSHPLIRPSWAKV